MILLKLSRKNIWRNKRRTLIVLFSIITGVVGLLITDAFSTGMVEQMLNNQIDAHYAHIQIYNKDYYDNNLIEHRIKNPEIIESVINNTEDIQAYSKRIEVFGLITSASNSSGVNIVAVEPDKEINISNIHQFVSEGTYLTGKSNEIIIGKELADKLEVELQDKIVTVTNAADGTVINELFRIVGIFNSTSSEFNKTLVYIPLQNAQQMLDAGNSVTNFTLRLKNNESADSIQKIIASKLSKEYTVKDYKDLLPMLVSMIEMYYQFIIIYYLIIGFAVVLGIINTTLMSVFERIQEFGVLLSIGMDRIKIFLMIITESALIGIIGSISGVIIGGIILIPLSASGIDLSIFAESLSSFGVGKIIYPEIGFHTIFYSLFTIPIATVIGALYPAYKALKLQPTDAMRYV